MLIHTNPIGSLAAALVVGLAGCTSPAAPGVPPSQPSVHTGDTGTVAPRDTRVDCSMAATEYVLGEPLSAPRANRSLAIGERGLVGWDLTSLVLATSPTESSLYVPDITAFGGMVWLDDGSLVVSEHLGTEDLLKIAPSGGSSVLASGIRAYGVVRGPDDKIYATTGPGTIYRIDPSIDSSPPLETFVTFPDGALPRVSDFSPAGDRMYVGSRDEDGQIWAIDIGPDHEPLGAPYRFAQTPGWFHDILVVDACGNLYVTAFHGGDFSRITPQGEVTVLATLPPEQHIHGAAWGIHGPDEGPWDDFTLFLAHPNVGNVVTTWAVGVPARDWRDGDFTTLSGPD